MSYYIMKPSQSSLLFFQAFLTRSEQKEGLFLCSHSFCFEPFLHFLWQWDWIKRRRKRNEKNNKIALIYFTGVKRKLIEWILYSLDVEMAQKLPIAVSSVTVFNKINRRTCHEPWSFPQTYKIHCSLTKEKGYVQCNIIIHLLNNLRCRFFMHRPVLCVLNPLGPSFESCFSLTSIIVYVCSTYLQFDFQ